MQLSSSALYLDFKSNISLVTTVCTFSSTTIRKLMHKVNKVLSDIRILKHLQRIKLTAF